MFAVFLKPIDTTRHHLLRFRRIIQAISADSQVASASQTASAALRSDLNCHHKNSNPTRIILYRSRPAPRKSSIPSSGSYASSVIDILSAQQELLLQVRLALASPRYPIPVAFCPLRKYQSGIGTYIPSYVSVHE